MIQLLPLSTSRFSALFVLSTELLTHYRQISQQPFTVVDVETTGRYPSHHRIIEISVLHATLADGVQIHRTDLVNPQVRVPDKISRFTGISQEMVDESAVSALILPSYLPLLEVGVLTAHNLEFDYAFLQAEYQRLNTLLIRSPLEQLCTVQLARLMLPDLPSRSLPDLVQHFQFQVGRSHRAEADTLACWLLAKRLLTEILSESDDILLAKFARQWMPIRIIAKLMGCSPSEGRSRLAAIGAESRRGGRNGNGKLMYRRGDVERVLAETGSN